MHRCPREKYRICGSQLVWSAANSCRKRIGVPEPASSKYRRTLSDATAYGIRVSFSLSLLLAHDMRNWNFAVNAHDCNAASDFVLSRKCPAEIRWTHRCPAALQSCSSHIRKL